MTRLIKYSLLSLGGLALVVIAAGILIINLDPNHYKDFIAQKISQKINRPFEIRQGLKIHYYPWLGMEASGIIIGNATGFDDSPFFEVDTLNIRLKTLPLIKKQIEMDTIILTGARINLAKNRAGISNWQDLGGQASPETKSKASPPPKKPLTKAPSSGISSKERKASQDGNESDSTPLENLAVFMTGGLDIRDVSIIYDDRASGVNYQVSELNITLDKFVPGDPIDLKIAFNGRAKPIDISGILSLTGTVSYDLDTGKYQIKPLKARAELHGGPVGETPALLTMTSAIEMDLERGMLAVRDIGVAGLGTTMEGRVTMDRLLSGSPLVDVDLDIKGQDLALLFNLFEDGPLAEQLAGLQDRAFKLKTTTHADFYRGVVEIPEFEAHLLGAVIKGNIGAKDIKSATPSLKGHLLAKGPDLPFLLQVAGRFEGKKSRLTSLGKRLAGVKNKAFLMETQFDADLKTGRLDLPGFSFQSLGISMDTHLVGTGVTSLMPSIKGRIKAKGPDLPLLMEMAGFFQEKESSLGSLGRQLARVRQKAFHMDVNLDVDMGQGRILLPNLTLAGLGIVLAGNINAQHLGSDKAVMAGQVSLEGKKMRPLLNALAQKDLADLLHSISLKAGINGNLQELQISPLGARVTLSGKQIPNSPVNLTLDADARVSVNQQTLELDSFSFKGLGLDASGMLHAQQIMTSPLYTGTLSLAKFNLRALMKKLNRSLPATADKRVFKKMAFKTKFSGAAGDIQLTELKMTLDQTRVRGVFGITNFADPDFGFDLKIDKVNVDRYLPVTREQSRSPLSKADKAVTAKNKPRKPITAKKKTPAVDTQIPMEKLRAFKGKGKLSIEDLIVSKAHLQKVRINLEARNGNISLAPLSAKLYKGTYTGKILLDATGKLPRLTVAAALKGVAAEPLLDDVTGEARIRGTGDAIVALTMKGGHADALKKSMNGKIQFSFKNGAVKGFNAGQFLRSLKSLGESQPFQMAAEEETDFTDLTGNPVVKKGVVFLNDLAGKSPALRLSGTGILANLVRETMDYTVNVTVVETSKGQAGKELAELSGITVPIHIKGALKDPSISPDISGVISSFATKELSQKLFKKLGIKSADPGAATDPKIQDLNQTQEQAPSEPVDMLKQTLEKELGNIFKGLFD